MDVLELDGKQYVRATKAARDLGYATDYVGQLCRGGQIDAHLIGRTWYVCKDDLATHKTEKKRMSRIKAREYAHKSIAEHRQKNVVPTDTSTRKLSISYSEDKSALIPETRRLSIESDLPKKPVSASGLDPDLPYTIVNPGQKIKLQGVLDVVDVTDGPVDEATVFLTPRIIRSKPVFTPHIEEESVMSAQDLQPQHKNFMDRLEELDATQTGGETDVAVTESDQGIMDSNQAIKKDLTSVQIPTSSLLKNITILLAVVTCASVLILISTAIEKEMIYRDDIQVLSSRYNFDISKVFDKLSIKI